MNWVPARTVSTTPEAQRVGTQERLRAGYVTVPGQGDYCPGTYGPPAQRYEILRLSLCSAFIVSISSANGTPKIRSTAMIDMSPV